MIDLKDNVVIGIAGRHNVGKSTMADHFLRCFIRDGVDNRVFLECGDAIRNFLGNSINANFDKINKIKTNPVIRDILEVIGPSYERHYGINLTIAFLNDAFKQTVKPALFIISGIRTPAEVSWIKDHKGNLILIRRPVYDIDGNIQTIEPLPTEKMLESFAYDIVISNDNTVEVFHHILDYYYSELLKSSWFESMTSVEP